MTILPCLTFLLIPILTVYIISKITPDFYSEEYWLGLISSLGIIIFHITCLSFPFYSLTEYWIERIYVCFIFIFHLIICIFSKTILARISICLSGIIIFQLTSFPISQFPLHGVSQLNIPPRYTAHLQ